MAITRHTVNALVTTSGGAAQSFYTDSPFPNGGLIEAIVYTNGLTSAGVQSSGFSTAAHITITGERSGMPILSVTATGTTGVVTPYFPRSVAQTNTGTLANRSYTTGVDGIALVPVLIPISGERIKIQVTSGGTASNGGLAARFDFLVSH